MRVLYAGVQFGEDGGGGQAVQREVAADVQGVLERGKRVWELKVQLGCWVYEKVSARILPKIETTQHEDKRVSRRLTRKTIA